MSLTSFREALQARIAADLDIPFVAGMIEGPIANRAQLGCCWARGKSEVGGAVGEEQITIMVRVYRRYNAPSDPELPIDPAPLEALAEAIQASVKADQTGLGPWFQRVVALEIDPRTQGVEATILAIQANQSVSGG